MTKQFLIRTLVLVSFFAVFQANAVRAFGQESAAAKTARLLNESGVKYTKAANNIWTVPFEAKDGKAIQVIVSTVEDVLFLASIVAENKSYKPTPELMKTLLLLNDKLDRVKIGFDTDGDLVTRIDLSIRVVDKVEILENLNQVAASVGDIRAAIKPFLSATK